MTPEQFHAIDTPRTDAAIINGEMADLELGHRHREIKDFSRQLEREVAIMEQALKAIVAMEDDPLVPAIATHEARTTLRTLAEIRKGTG